MNAYKPGTDWTMDMLRTAETVATLETPKERAKATLEALIAAEGRGARLSAAPEMLEALEAVADIPKRDCPWGCMYLDHDADCPVSKARAAVAKTEGRQP